MATRNQNSAPAEPQQEPSQYFLVRLEGEPPSYIVCEAIVSFDGNNLFPLGANTLDVVFREFHDDTVATVAVLPPLSDPKWAQIGAVGQLAGPGDDGGP